MTKPVIQIRKQPKSYKIDPKKLAKAPQSILPYLFVNIFYYEEEYKYFDLIKPYLDIPEETKSLEEIQQEFHEKIDELIEQTKRNFYASNLTAERKYNDFCDRQDSAFDYMQKNGCPPVKYFIDYSKVKVPLLNSAIISSDKALFEIKPIDSVGYYEISPGYRFCLKQKPSRVVRIVSSFLLGWVWKDT